MNKLKRFLGSIFCTVLLFFLIIDTKSGIAGASEAITLCMQTVVPSLFPMMFLACVLSRFLMPGNTPISSGSRYIFLMGLLGGYPIGAQLAADLYHTKKTSRANALRSLAFCSNAGPAFIFGVTGALFPSPLLPFILWGIQILSAVIVSALLPRASACTIFRPSEYTATIRQCFDTCLRGIAGICGWVILFRVLLEVLRNWVLWRLNIQTQILISGFLELTNGCHGLLNISSLSLRFVFCAAFLSFGGVCVCMQTNSVIRGLSTSTYLLGKLLQCGISTLLSITVGHFMFPAQERINISLYPILIIFFVICSAFLLLHRKIIVEIQKDLVYT